jgi:hypothetical protein
LLINTEKNFEVLTVMTILFWSVTPLESDIDVSKKHVSIFMAKDGSVTSETSCGKPFGSLSDF